MIESVDILTHRMVPGHEVISGEEKKRTLEGLNAEKEQLPKILVSDAVVKKINAKPGDIIRITRDSVTAGKSVYYRIVSK